MIPPVTLNLAQEKISLTRGSGPTPWPGRNSSVVTRARPFDALLSWATIRAYKAATEARERGSTATLPANLVARSGALRQRMLRCCEY